MYSLAEETRAIIKESLSQDGVVSLNLNCNKTHRPLEISTGTRTTQAEMASLNISLNILEYYFQSMRTAHTVDLTSVQHMLTSHTRLHYIHNLVELLTIYWNWRLWTRSAHWDPGASYSLILSITKSTKITATTITSLQNELKSKYILWAAYLRLVPTMSKINLDLWLTAVSNPQRWNHLRERDTTFMWLAFVFDSYLTFVLEPRSHRG